MLNQAISQPLATLIAPGKRSRLPSFVESAQIQALFGQFPNAKNRAASIQEILKQNSPRIEAIGLCWVQFSHNEGKNFADQDYLDSDFLDVYLVYYFKPLWPFHKF